MAMSILPLPWPLGLDKANVIHQPVRLHVKPGNLQTHTQITDDFGREIVCWEKQSFSFSKRRLFYTPEGRRLYTLRAHGTSVLQGCLIGGPKGWYFEGPDGKEIGWIEPDGLEQNTSFDLGFVNRAGGGENFQLRMRGKLTDGSAALMLGNMPGEHEWGSFERTVWE